MQRYRVTPEMDAYYRGPPGKQVSFMGEEHFSETESRHERKPNSYNCDPPAHVQDKYFGTSFQQGDSPQGNGYGGEGDYEMLGSAEKGSLNEGVKYLRS